MYFFIARQHRNLKKLTSAEIMLPEHAYASNKIIKKTVFNRIIRKNKIPLFAYSVC